MNPSGVKVASSAGSPFVDVEIEDGNISPDLDHKNLPMKPCNYESDLIYDSRADSSVSRVAAIGGQSNIQFTIQLPEKCRRENDDNKMIAIDPSGRNLTVSSFASEWGDAQQSYIMNIAYIPIPCCLNRNLRFVLKRKDQPDVTWTLPVELYIIPMRLPKYFRVEGLPRPKVPLLFLRMFIGAATKQGVTTEKDWIALVVNICHGSKFPFTGEVSRTENHWLKYDVESGSSSFVRANKQAVARSSALGGDFFLSAWLRAYRLWKAKNRVTTKVNCYDMAAIVEIALSLGMDANKVAWEFHQAFGFITANKDGTGSKLIGQGSCNNPFFGEDLSKMFLDPQDETRSFFGNHAFLVWHPDFNPDADYYKRNQDPRQVSEPKMYAIDACAGPHPGHTLRGIWDDAWEVGKAKNNITYSNVRDNDYNHDKFDPEMKGLEARHRWTPGIIGLAADALRSDVYIPLEDPFKDKWSDFAPPDYPHGSTVFAGNVASLLKDFENEFRWYTGESQKWQPVSIGDVMLDKQYLCRESKLYAPDKDTGQYCSVRITTFQKYKDACDYLQSSLGFEVLSSNLEVEDLKKQIVEDVTVLYANHECMFVYKNLHFEVSGGFNGDKLLYIAKQLISQVRKEDDDV